MTERRNPYTDEEVEKLKQWAVESAQTTGRDDLDSPRRKAGNDFADLVMEARDRLNPPANYPELADPLGMKPDTLRAKLARRKKVDPSPSMRVYKAKPHNVNKKTATHFGCGCARIPDNTYWKPGQVRADGTQAPDIDYCRHHQLKRLKRRGATQEAAA